MMMINLGLQLLALFEVCAHPRHSSERCTSALVVLDSIIRSLSLTLVDADDPNATHFSRGSVPAVPDRPQQRSAWLPEPLSVPHPSDTAGCSCSSLTLVEHWPSATEHTPLWAPTPAWNVSWSEGEIRKESCRRLCWSSMILAAGHISYTTANRAHAPDLFIADPANVCVPVALTR